MKRLAILFLLIVAGTAVAEPKLSLPLDGYYRPGKFFPVQVETDTAINVRIDVAAGVGSRLKVQTESFSVPAMFLSTAPRSVRVLVDDRPFDLPVRPLEPTQSLVLTTLSPDRLKSLPLPADRVSIVVQLPPERLAQLGTAYESADAVLLRPEDLETLRDNTLQELAACGTTVAVAAPVVEKSALPWRTVGQWSVLDLPVRGPTNSLEGSAAYEAVATLTAARTPAQRRTIWLGMAMFSIAALATAMLRRRGIVALAGVTAVASIAVAVYAWRQSPVSQDWFFAMIPAGRWTQLEDWTFCTSLSETEHVQGMSLRTSRPIFAGQGESVNAWIETKGWNQAWNYHVTLKPGVKMAFVDREFVPPPPAQPMEPANPSAYRDTVMKMYQQPDERVRAAPVGSNFPQRLFLIDQNE